MTAGTAPRGIYILLCVQAIHSEGVDMNWLSSRTKNVKTQYVILT